MQDVSVVYTTADAYSRRWFYPRYAGGKIHEESVTRLLAEYMANSQCFVDIGAHIGFYTCLASRLMPGRPVHSFELNELFHRILLKNVKLNGGCDVHDCHAAVASASGHAAYAKRPRRFYNARLAICPNAEANGETPLVSVPSVSLDDYFESRDPRPDLVKIDVEGAEMMVLSGMRRLLSTQRMRLFIEVHPHELRSFGSSVQAVVAMLVEYGYALQEIGDFRSAGASARLRTLDHETDLAANTMLFAEKRIPR